MSTSGSSSAEKRSRSTRVAPRRHVNPAETAGAYDSGEFPVLLRMPDVTRPIVDDEAASADDVATTNDMERDGTARTNRRSTRRSEFVDRSVKGGKSTGSAVARFWAAMPPRIAAGGMLLAVIGLCLFVMRPKNNSELVPQDKLVTWPSQPSSDNQSDQAAPSMAQQPSELANGEPPSEAPNLYGPRSVVASKTNAPDFADPAGTASGPTTTLTGPQDMSPTFSGADEFADDAPEPVTGWPEETEVTNDQPQIEAAANPILPSLKQY